MTGQIIKQGDKEFSLAANSLSNHEKIIELIKHSSGLTIAEISRSLGITRNTVSISLARLEGAEQVNIRKVGMAKLYSFKKELQVKKEIEEDEKIKRKEN